ncbi:hypothetical protein ACVNF4_01050 [Streptomyces sp. S6]
MATATVTDRYGTAQTTVFDRLHPKLTTRSAWLEDVEHSNDYLPIRR